MCVAYCGWRSERENIQHDYRVALECMFSSDCVNLDSSGLG